MATKMAAALGVGQPTISRILSGKQGTTEQVATKILRAAGVDPSEFGLHSISTDLDPQRPRLLGTLPTWAETEALARSLYPHLSEASWLGARKFSTEVQLPTLTPDVVLHLALAVEAAGRRAS